MKKIGFVSIIVFCSLSVWAQLFEISFDPIFRNQEGNPYALALTGGMNQPQFSNIDLNNDGKQDLFVYDRNGNKVLTFLTKIVKGNLTYIYEPKYEELFPLGQEFMQLHDYNQDQNPDLWLYTGDSVVLYQNNGTTFPQFDKIKGLFAFDRVNYVPFNPYKKLSEIKGCLPAIVDVDGDSDLDFITNLNVTGSQMIFNRNTSADSNFQLEKITYDIVDKCFGGVDEYNAELIINAPCYFYEAYKQKKKHVATKTILLFDEDEDGDMDLLFGSSERATNPIYFFRNGKADLNYYKDTFLTIDSMYFSEEIEPLIPVAPAMSYVDVDLDGIKDLVLSSNEIDKSSYPIHEANNVLLFLNKGTSNNVDFVFQNNDFLVGDMIDFGSHSSPTFVDLDGDMDQDLILGTSGNHYVTGDTTDFLVYFENIGTSSMPDFKLIDGDYLGLKSQSIQGIVPTFTDIDGDDDMDLFVGKLDGTISYYQNIGSKTSPSFTFITAIFEDIQVENFAAPHFDDINGDGLTDLLVGRYNGTIDYYKNSGSETSPVFALTQDTFGGIIVNELVRTSKLGSDGVIYDTMVYQNYGYSAPEVLHWNNGSRCIAVGNNQGVIRLYEITSDLSQDFVEMENFMKKSFSEALYSKDWGRRTYLSSADLNADGNPDIMVGNDRGGLSFMKGFRKTNRILTSKPIGSFRVIPNPTSTFFTIETDTKKQFDYTIYDLTGSVVTKGSTFSESRIHVTSLTSGMYFVGMDDGLKNYPLQKLFVHQL